MSIMKTEGTVVDDCVELPYPSASRELVDHAASLGLKLPDDPSRPGSVFEVLRWCIQHHRVASIVYLTDVEGNPWHARVEPHAFHRSKEGIRLRCYLPAQEDEPDVVSDFQTNGWHLYLIEDMESAQAGSAAFKPRPYARSDDEVSITIVFGKSIAV
jgi:hypothetical protein